MLAAFVLLTYFTVRHSVHTRAEQALFQQLQGLVYGILGAADLQPDNQLAVKTGELPDQRLLSSVTGLSARVTNGFGETVWTSPAVLPVNVQFATTDNPPAVGEWQFQTINHDPAAATEAYPLYRLLTFTTSWQGFDNTERTFIVSVISDATDHTQQLQSFDRNLWIGLLTTALLLLLVQLLVLTWSLKPLGKIGRELKAIEAGKAQSIDEQLPVELKPLAGSINTLLSSERQRHSRYRHVVDDLAHSLKTPLSVLNNLNPAADSPQLLQDTIQEQTGRMHDIVSYHTQRAATDRVVLSPPTSPTTTLKRLADSLNRIYRTPPRQFQVTINPGFVIRLSDADMMEAFGNILDNSCKYGATDIHVHSGDKNQTTALYIDDNGVGFGSTAPAELVQRGRRADTMRPESRGIKETATVDGQGLGLAIAVALFEGAGATVTLGHSPQGGARVTITLAG